MNEPCYWILRCEHKLLAFSAADPQALFPMAPTGRFATLETAVLVGEHQGRACYAAELANWPELAGAEAISLRQVFELAGEEAFALAGRAVQLLDWRQQHRYCGRCGVPTQPKPGETAMACPDCGLLAYPRLSPAIMVLVRDGERLLLARSPRFKPGVYSALAGFVEPGETLEQCAAREVREEVGIEIANLRYFASQPWPFPNSLMIAFFADYAGGELQLDPLEIEAAEWFTADSLPILPEPISISRRLIDAACQLRST